MAKNVHAPFIVRSVKRGKLCKMRITSVYMRLGRICRSAIMSFAIIMVVVCEAFALNPNRTIDEYGHSIWLRLNGLPANAINSALQTRDGYIWLATSAGLFRFDGVSFDQVSIDPENSANHETINSLCQTQDGSLWIGTGYTGLRRLINGKMMVYRKAQAFLDTQIKELFESRSGHFYVGTSVGLYLFKDDKFIPVMLDPNFITALAEDSLGRIWVGTHDGVRIFMDGNPSNLISLTTQDGLSSDVITDIYADRAGNVWMGSVNGLCEWTNGKITTFTMNSGLTNNFVSCIFQDRDNNIWFGTHAGLCRLDNGKWSSYSVADGLTDNNVTSITADHEGSLWVCTSDGLNQFYDAPITTWTTYEGLANDYVSSVIEMPDKSLCFLSDQGSSLTFMNRGKITKYNTVVGPAYVARDKSLWIGQSGVLSNFANGRIKQYGAENGIPPKWISAITEDDKSLIVYLDHKGIFRFINGQLQPYLMADSAEYPRREYVVCFLWQAAEKAMWIGTADGLVRFQDGHYRNFTVADGLAADWVSSIYDDHHGTLWISSPQGGLSRYRDGKFTAYNTRVGLFTDELYCVLEDNEGGIWMSSPRGIGYTTAAELDEFACGAVKRIHTKVYTTADGMKTDECFGDWQPAGWKTRDGDIWFATKHGAVKIDPNAFKQNRIVPPVLVEEVIADQKPLDAGASADLVPGTKELEFHYTALSFLIPHRVNFKYKLDGYDRDWVYAGTRRAAYYTNLPPGDYNFHVIACNDDGVWNTEGASFAFMIEPHFYQTAWFYVLVGLMGIGIIFGLYRFRVWQLLQREKMLRSRIDEALANIKTLGGLIPICSNCKKIRDDKGYWEHLERYIQTHSDAKFSHGICPECMAKLYPDIRTGESKDHE